MNTFYFHLTNGRDYAYMESDYDISADGRGYLLIDRKKEHSIFFPYANILIVERREEELGEHDKACERFEGYDV